MNRFLAAAAVVVALTLLAPSASATSPLALGQGATLQGDLGQPASASASLTRDGGTARHDRGPVTALDSISGTRATFAAPVQVRTASTSSGAASAKAYARARLSAGEYGCLLTLWTRESGWNPRDLNPSSGAYGIPQAVPGSKMASAGADWRTDPITQVRWGLGYIHARYSTPCAALSHSYRFNWY